MIEQCFARTSVVARLRLGPLGSHLDARATTLYQYGYALDSMRRAGDQFGLASYPVDITGSFFLSLQKFRRFFKLSV